MAEPVNIGGPRDPVTHAIKWISVDHAELHEGRHFTSMYGVPDIGALTSPDNTISMTFLTPNSTRLGHMIVLFGGVGGTLCQVREGGSGGITPTGIAKIYNNNRNSANISGLTDIASNPEQISLDATLDTGGELLVNEYIPGAITNQSAVGGGAESGGRYEWMLKPNTRYQVSMTVSATVACSIVLHHYEHISEE